MLICRAFRFQMFQNFGYITGSDALLRVSLKFVQIFETEIESLNIP